MMDKALLTSRYVEEKVEKSEQQSWEEAQAKKAQIGGGAKGSFGDGKGGDDKYDLVFEEDQHIEFEMTDHKKGYDRRTKGKHGSRRTETIIQTPISCRTWERLARVGCSFRITVAPLKTSSGVGRGCNPGLFRWRLRDRWHLTR